MALLTKSINSISIAMSGSSQPKKPKTIIHQSSPSRDTQLMPDYRLPPGMDVAASMSANANAGRRPGGHRRVSPGKRQHLKKQISKNSVQSDLSSDRRSNTSVYVKDAVYVWLPAQILSTTEERAMVKIVIPDDWANTTVLDEKSSIAELEYETTAGGFGSYSSPKFGGQSEDAKNISKKRRCYAYERDQLEYDESIPKGIQRTLALRDYQNSELPLQNTDRHAQRLLSSKNLSQKNTICHPLVNARDMADLHFLHEAAILYNLKQRHAQNLPYTRVGDIIVAVNPFQWIDGLYSSEKQSLYAQHLIWDAKDFDVDEKTMGLQQEDVSDLGNISDAGESGVYDTFGDASGMAPLTPAGKTISFQIHESEAQKKNDSSERHEPMSHGSIYSRLGLEPHVYEAASLAYRGLACDRENQTILVSGESGAGKTETVKIVMSNLATVEQTRPFYRSPGKGLFSQSDSGNQMSSVVKKVLESNPVFEAFGCAKTIRNDNSSRFGRFTQLQYEVESKRSAEINSRKVLPHCLLNGSYCATYLLEKSRVVGHAHGERNYHIFYQLLSAPESEKALIWEELAKSDYDSFAYVGKSSTDTIEGQLDSESWHSTVKALKSFGFVGETFRLLLRALCIVLQLGNLTFSAAPPLFEEGSSVSSQVELAKLSKLMGIPKEDIAKAMTTRVNKIRGEEVTARPNSRDAKDGCDALAKTIYACIFDNLVKQINKNTSVASEVAEKGTIGTISLLDIFGFERFDVNRFEQLCINFSNERLQHRYVLDNFRSVKEEYTAEGIEMFDFSMVDNAGVLEFLEGKLGLITSLNEECVRPQGKASSFVYKIKMLHNDSKDLLVDRLQKPCEFGINHFAGAVTYDASEFLQRNTDLTPKDLLRCASQTTNSLIKTELDALISASSTSGRVGPPRRATARTVMAKFRSQLNVLMNTIELTKTRYIRCIKPNTKMSPRKLNHRETMNQLQSAGLVTAITISRETFPNRLPYEVVWERFSCLDKTEGFVSGLKDDLTKTEQFKANVENLLKSLLLKPFARADGARVPSFCCGNTRVYFRTGALEQLESDRMHYYSIFASIIGNWYRSKIARLKYARFRNMVISIQSRSRMHTARRKFIVTRDAAIIIQSIGRMLKYRTPYLHQRNAAIMIGGIWRAFIARKLYITSILQIVSAQSTSRAFIARRRFATLRRAVIIVQSFLRGCNARTIARNLLLLRNSAREENRKTLEKNSISSATSAYNDDELAYIDASNRSVRFKNVKTQEISAISPSMSSDAFVSCESSLQTDDAGERDIRKDMLSDMNLKELEITKEQVSKLQKENRDLTMEIKIRSSDIQSMTKKLEIAEEENASQKYVFERKQRHSEEQLQLLRDESHNYSEINKTSELTIARMQSTEGLLQEKILEMEDGSMRNHAKLSELHENIIKLEKDCSIHRNSADNLNVNILSMEKDIVERDIKLVKLEQFVTSLDGDIKMRDKTAGDLRNQIDSLGNENEEMDTELKSCHGEINTLRSRITYLEKETDEMNSELEASCEEVNVFKASVKSLEMEVNAANSELSNCFSEIDSLKAQVLSLLKKLEDRDEQNKVLKDQVASLEKHVTELNDKLEASQSESQDIAKQLKLCKIEVSNMVEQVESFDKIISTKDDEIVSLTKKIGSLQDKIGSRDHDIAHLQDKVDSLNFTIEERDEAAIVVQKEMASLKKSITTREGQAGDLENQLELLQKDMNSIQNRAVSLEETVASGKATIVGLQDELEHRNETISSLQMINQSHERSLQDSEEDKRNFLERIASLELENEGTTSELRGQIAQEIKIKENVARLEEELRDRNDKLAIIQILNTTLENTINSLKKENTDLKNELDSMLEEKSDLIVKLEESTKEANRLKEQGVQLESQNESLYTEVTSLQNEIQSLKRNQSSIEEENSSRQGVINDLRTQITSLEESLSLQHTECDDLKTQIMSHVEEKKIIKVEASRCEDAAKKCKEELAALNIQLESRDELVNSINNELFTLKQNLRSKDDNIQVRSDQISSMEKDKEQVSTKFKAKETTLTKEVVRLEDVLQRHQLEIDTLKSQLQNSQEKYEDTRRTCSNAQVQEEEAQQEVTLLNELVETLRETIDKYDNQVVGLSSEIENLKQERDRTDLSNAGHITSLENEILDLTKINEIQCSETDLQHLHDQLVAAQARNIELSEELDNIKISKADLMNDMQSLVTASKSATNRSQSLLQTNKTLLTEIGKLKLSNPKPRKHDKVEYATPHYDRIVHDRDSEIVVLKEALADSKRGRELFAQSVERKMSRERESMLSEIHSLKERLQMAQDTSDDYKHKIIDVLQTSHSKRETEVRKLKKEIKRLNLECLKSNVASENTLSSLAKRHQEEQQQSIKTSQRDKNKKVVHITNLVLKLKSEKPRATNMQSNLFDQIINSMEDFCKSEEQQSTMVSTPDHVTRGGWAPYPPQSS